VSAQVQAAKLPRMQERLLDVSETLLRQESCLRRLSFEVTNDDVEPRKVAASVSRRLGPAVEALSEAAEWVCGGGIDSMLRAGVERLFLFNVLEGESP